MISRYFTLDLFNTERRSFSMEVHRLSGSVARHHHCTHTSTHIITGNLPQLIFKHVYFSVTIRNHRLRRHTAVLSLSVYLWATEIDCLILPLIALSSWASKRFHYHATYSWHSTTTTACTAWCSQQSPAIHNSSVDGLVLSRDYHKYASNKAWTLQQVLAQLTDCYRIS